MTSPTESLDLLIGLALSEDLGDGDRTAEWTVPAESRSRARVVAKSRAVVSGLAVARKVFLRVDPDLQVEVRAEDGDLVQPGTVLLDVVGPTRAILSGERTALNFLGRLSGVATLTRAFVDAAAGTQARITDTRKTTPGWRALEKGAVRAGGGSNHRMGLYDMVLVKENHAAAAGGVERAARIIHGKNTERLPVEIEVRTLEELDRLRGLPVDRILLDNFSTPDLSLAVVRVQGWDAPRPALEASGNMALARIPEVAATGVDWISVGALTHSAPVADFSLLLDEVPPLGSPVGSPEGSA
jgi:nicotinate-nucleotide pyrophosphorylase (carboxylating)